MKITYPHMGHLYIAITAPSPRHHRAITRPRDGSPVMALFNNLEIMV